MRRFDRHDKETAQRFQRRAKCAGEIGLKSARTKARSADCGFSPSKPP
jgi:hypothetical protein